MANSFRRTGETPKPYLSDMDIESEFAAGKFGEIL